MSAPRSSLAQLVLFRVREFTREPAVLFWAVIFPLLMLFVLGLAFRPQPPAPKIVILESEGVPAEKLRSALAASKDLDVRGRPKAEAELALRRGEGAVLVSPGTPPVLRFDPTHPEARETRLAVEAALRRAEHPEEAPAVTTDEKPAPGGRYIDWFVPGMLGMQVMNGSLWGLGFAVAEMRGKKLLKRFAVTPMKRWQFVIAQVVHRFIVVLVEAVIMCGFASVVFGVSISGSLVAYAVALTVGTLALSGVGLLIAARPKNTEAAAGLMNVAMLPQMVFSGVFFSAAKFPDAIQPAIRALPLTALLDALRRISNEGAGLDGIGRELVVLTAWGIVTFALAIRFFRWS